MPSIQIKKVRFYNLKLVQTKFMCKYPCTGLKKNIQKILLKCYFLLQKI